MKRGFFISDLTAMALIFMSIVLLLSSVLINGMPGDTDRSAMKMERRIVARMARLESLSSRNPSTAIPSDMVIYRYYDDTLKTWQNQFPILNDDISTKVFYKRLVNPGRSLQSPLVDVSDSVTFMNLGPKWYLVRSADCGLEKVITGLEIVNTMDRRSFNGVNPRFHLGPAFTVKPLSSNGGSEVRYGGIPQFKVICDAMTAGAGSETDEGGVVWLSFFMFLVACVIILRSHVSLRVFSLYSLSLIVSCGMMYGWSFVATDLKLFSPLLFAGGSVLHSLGSVIIINIFIFFLSVGLYLVRRQLRNVTFPVLLASGMLLIYIHSALKSIIHNSNIQLELYNISEISWWTGIVYVSFLSVFISLVLLLRTLEPRFSVIVGKKVDILGGGNMVVITACATIFMMLITSVHGFRKEQDMMEVWSNRLAVERDISLEMRLRRIENRISGDVLISSLAELENSGNIIRNLITDNYLQALSSDYNVNAFVVKENSPVETVGHMMELLKGAENLAEGSSFFYKETRSGRPRYVGLFSFIGQDGSVNQVIVDVETKFGYGEGGYMRIMGSNHPGRMRLPARYAYARYDGGSLHNFNGNYPYPVTMDRGLYGKIYEEKVRCFKAEGYRHFVNFVSENEAVVISRPEISWFSYIVSAFFISLVTIFMLWVISGRKQEGRPMKNYYKSRLTWVMMIALVFTLLSMAVASIYWMYSRNTANINTILSDKIGSIQSMIQSGLQQTARDGDGLLPLLENAAANTGSDISLYYPDGRLMVSTSPEIFNRQILGSRVNQKALERIMHMNRRFFFNREVADGTVFYCMYAPVMDMDGKVAAILSSPYTGSEIYDFESDALKNLFSITMLFLVLLLLARVALIRVLDKMFNPLIDMAGKMEGSDLESLEPISYDRDDEVAVLVNAYNRMVAQLSENSRTLAQAERDKAWSGMARQVAHEIKNPLTPMKLQLQRIIRMKARGDAEWQNKFDDVGKVLLDHIDILTDTANEFSTFAKLYTEEPTEVNLDNLLQEEISMFDNRDNIRFSYMGLDNAIAMAPKPQLTRVFVNLINNAVQAVESQEVARILVSLRNSSDDGFYDIVFEDSGPGVSEENVGRLFTPNFTTKNGGSGLGLAISRSILERCDASITYCRSFHLGGACFSIRYPKKLV